MKKIIFKSFIMKKKKLIFFINKAINEILYILKNYINNEKNKNSYMITKKKKILFKIKYSTIIYDIF